ncbi:hypothetical protein NRA52_12100 [Acinetobacter baumannii]|nr:hypothetical protein [Acinetobacter baumannii]
MKPEQFIREYGVDEAKRILERAPEDATHYRDLSCGTRYTKNVSGTECYVWTNKHWRRSVVPYQIFTSEVIKPLPDLKRLVESVDLVNSLGGIKAARSEAHKDCFAYNQSLLAAIAAYESIYGGGDE